MDQSNPDEKPGSLKMPQEEEQRIDYSILNQPEPMGGSGGSTERPKSLPQKSSTPSHLEPPHRPIVPLLLMVFLALIVVAAVLVFFSWKGWIKIGQNFWQKTTPAPTASPTVTTSPSIENSPEIIANVNDQARKSDLENIQQALKRYFVDKGSFPSTNGSLVKTSDSESILAKALVPTYLEKLPDDPLAPKDFYGYKSDGASYELTCILEDTSDPAGFKNGDLYLYKITNTK